MGSRTKYGNEEFYKVDHTYVLNSSFLCEIFTIPHFSLISSNGANAKSCFFYFEVKGKIEEELKNLHSIKKIESLTIFQPGLIVDRDNDSRIGECCLKYMPFISKIRCSVLAAGMINEAERLHYDYDNNGRNVNVFNNRDIINLSNLII